MLALQPWCLPIIIIQNLSIFSVGRARAALLVRCYLFWPLAIAIRNNNSIRGIMRYGIEHKLSLYADDLLLFLSKAEETVPSVLELCEKFGSLSGYKLNLHKSELVPLNMSDSVVAQINALFKISKHSFVYLGLTVTTKLYDLFKENFVKLQLKTQQDLSAWSPLTNWKSQCG